MVHPDPTPLSDIFDINISSNDPGNTQNLKAFNRGNCMSATSSISGISQLPNPPIITGITKKKIITNA